MICKKVDDIFRKYFIRMVGNKSTYLAIPLTFKIERQI